MRHDGLGMKSVVLNPSSILSYRYCTSRYHAQFDIRYKSISKSISKQSEMRSALPRSYWSTFRRRSRQPNNKAKWHAKATEQTAVTGAERSSACHDLVRKGGIINPSKRQKQKVQKQIIHLAVGAPPKAAAASSSSITTMIPSRHAAEESKQTMATG